MPLTLVIHILDEDPVVGEAEELPESTDTFIRITNPRRVDGKDLHYLAVGVVEAFWPLHRINFVEILPVEEEEIIGFVRE